MEKHVKKLLIPLLFAVVVFFLSIYNVFYTVDNIVCDKIYQIPSPVNSKIKIIKIDEKTLDAYGPLNTWNREIPARLVSTLNAKEESKPNIIAFDVMYIGEVDQETDDAYALACKEGGNVISAANIVFKTVIKETQTGEKFVDKFSVGMIEYPYNALKNNSTYGFANTLQDKDSYVRQASTSVEYNGEIIDSLSMEIYTRYKESKGEAVILPKLYNGNRFQFTYSGKIENYEAVSLVDVLNGNIDPKVFKDCIVLVGAYAPGLQDAFNVPIERGRQMYGVEIHANIVEALLEGKTAIPANIWLVSLCSAILALGYAIFIKRIKVVPAFLVTVGIVLLDLLGGRLLRGLGITIGLITLPICIVIFFIVQIVFEYISEIIKRKKVVNAFKKYVAPQVVDEIAKQGEFNVVLGGENRNIAVLFVDIRGFTPMSESLQPEQVVEILNEYLNLTTNAIFHNGGTLDKFIGDATMAVFNAPFELEDYVFKAVCTARDIAAGSQKLEEELQKRFGKTVSFGIGVNCGNAVVGNIGCDFRMDYTAIGDVVNTAARLESNAKPGQILISQDVYEVVKERVHVNEIGIIPLKGKSKGVFVYEVTEVLD